MYPDTDQRERKEIKKIRDEIILVKLLKPVQTEFHSFSTD